jgi:hypothetical protein
MLPSPAVQSLYAEFRKIYIATPGFSIYFNFLSFVYLFFVCQVNKLVFRYQLTQLDITQCYVCVADPWAYHFIYDNSSVDANSIIVTVAFRNSYDYSL